MNANYFYKQRGTPTPSSARHVGLSRVLRMMESLKVRRWKLRELAAEHGVTTRTIRRDLDTLSHVGIPVRKTRDGETDECAGVWWIEA